MRERIQLDPRALGSSFESLACVSCEPADLPTGHRELSAQMSSRGKQRATEGPAASSLQLAKGKHRLRPQEKAEQDVVNSLSTSRLKAAIRQSKRFLARVRGLLIVRD